MSMRQPINNEMETRLIHPEEAHYESQATVRPDNRPESRERSIKSPRILKTDSICSHEIKIDKSYRPLDSDDNHAGLIVGALVASTIFTLFAIGTLPSPFASISGKRSESSLNLDSSPRPLVSKREDRFPIHGTTIQTDRPSCAIIARLKHFLFVSPSEIICGRSAHNSINSQSSRLTDSSSNSLRRRKRDRQLLKAGRFVKLLMARRSWKGRMASGGCRAAT